MRRFDFDEDDPDKEEIERFLESEDGQQFVISPEQYKDLIEEELTLYQTKFQHEQQKNNFKVLLVAINLLKKSFWWKFYSLNTKLKSIERTYKSLTELLHFEFEEK
jgi:hypothetical protein